MKPTLRASLGAALAFGTIAGCEGGLGPEAADLPAAGSYALVSISGQAPPAAFELNEHKELTVLADTLHLGTDGRWERRTLALSRSLVTGYLQLRDTWGGGDLEVLPDGGLVLSSGPCDDVAACLPPDTVRIEGGRLLMNRSATLYFLEDLVFEG